MWIRKIFFQLYILVYLWINSKLVVKGFLRILPDDNVIDGITVHLIQKFIQYKVYAKGLYLNANLESTNVIKKIIEQYKKETDLHCNLNKEQEKETIINDIIETNSCVIFMHVTYKDHLKHIFTLMDYLIKNTSAVGLILICDNFLYENEIYNPHEELNLTIIEPTILTYIVSQELMLPYKLENFSEYQLELFWGVYDKTDIVHIDYHLDFGKYFNYCFFIYMKPVFWELKNYLTYKVEFSIHNNFTIDPRFCFIRDSSYCISKPDYMNSNVVREVIEQQVRSLCIYEKTLVNEEKKQDPGIISYLDKVEKSQKEIISKENVQKNNIKVESSDRAEEIKQSYKINQKKANNKEKKITKAKNITNMEKKNYFENDEHKISNDNTINTPPKRMFSDIFVMYINYFFDLNLENPECFSEDSRDSSKKCSDKILKLLDISSKEIDNCFVNNFHTYMQQMIKRKFYIYSISINGRTYKMKLNKDISIKLICSAFIKTPQYCLDYLTYMIENEAKGDNRDIHINSFYFLITTMIVHIIGSFLNSVVPNNISVSKFNK